MRMKKLMALLLTLCVCASLMMPMASAANYYDLDSLAGGIKASIGINTASAYETGYQTQKYNLSLSAQLQVPDLLASTMVAAGNRNDAKALRFTCVLTLKGTQMTDAEWDAVDVSSVSDANLTGPGSGYYHVMPETLIKGKGQYTPLGGTPVGSATDRTIALTYKLDEAIVDGTTLIGGDALTNKTNLMQVIYFAYSLNNLSVAKWENNTNDARVEADVYVAQYDSSTAPATLENNYWSAHGATDLYITYQPSGGSGSSTSGSITLTETDTSTGKSSTTNGLNSAKTDASGNKDENDYPASGGAVSVVSVTSQNGKPKTGNPSAGDTVVINVDPNPGKKIDSVTITMANGQKVTVEYLNDGNYEFVMPSGAIKVDVDYESCPYLPSDSGVDELLITDRHVLYTIGDDEGNWRPYANVKRDEVAIMFQRLLRNQDVTITTSYDDVPEDAWYYEAVNKISSLGVLQGDGDGNFRPEEPMTRAEFAKACVGFATKDPIAPGADFSDFSRLAWYYSYIQKAVAFGWIEGYNGEFRPDDYITRTEAVTIINRMLARPADHDAIDNGAGTSFPDVPDNFWGRDAIEESTTAHNETVDEPTYVEEWHENGTETVNG